MTKLSRLTYGGTCEVQAPSSCRFRLHAARDAKQKSAKNPTEDTTLIDRAMRGTYERWLLGYVQCAMLAFYTEFQVSSLKVSLTFVRKKLAFVLSELVFRFFLFLFSYSMPVVVMKTSAIWQVAEKPSADCSSAYRCLSTSRSIVISASLS